MPYKLTDGFMCSAYVDKLAKGYTSYAIGHKTVPHPDCGPLCAFDTLDGVKAHLEDHLGGLGPLLGILGLRLFECDVEPCDVTDPDVPHYPDPSHETGYLTFSHLWNLPLDTILCRSITLTKEVHP